MNFEPPTHLVAVPSRLVLAAPGDSAMFRVAAYTADGFTAVIGPEDVRVGHDASLVAVERYAEHAAAADLEWRVTALAGDAATRVDVVVGELSAPVVVAVGTRTARLAGAEAGWRFRAARAEGRLRRGRGAGGPEPAFVELEYDFTHSTATRAVYADLEPPVPVPGRPVALSVWIDADASGTWPSLDCRDAEGTRVVLRGEHLTWRGPRECRMPVPESVAYPLTLHGFYLAEPRPEQRGRGRVGFGDIGAVVPPDTEPTTRPGAGLPFPVWFPPYDPDRPLFTAGGLGHGSGESRGPDAAHAAAGPLFTDDVADRAWRFAVVSDTQFVAARPDDGMVVAARTVLRDIAATDCALVLVNGDFVDEGSPADLALARRILDEELADGPPWVYVPGNHEVAGGDAATFAAAFGPARREFDHRGVRFLTLDTSSLRVGEKQLAWLRERLDRATGDAAVAAVVVAGHVPPHDPTGHRASRLVDRAEAAALEAALAGFAASGKGCAYVAGHAGAFASWLRDGVAYVVNGNSGKEPAVPPSRGGLLGWSECGVASPATGTVVRQRVSDWLAVRVRPVGRRPGHRPPPHF